MNYGATFTGLQLGTATLTSCAISYDGSYITISSGATVYTLNNNSIGFSVALGNQAGYQNQGQNAIAIGNYAGYQNQTANSIILNATGLVVNAVAQGFYVAPIASYTVSSAQSFALLGYGSDNQVVQITNITMSPVGNVGFTANVGIGTTNPTTALTITNNSSRNISPNISMYGYSDVAGFGPGINFYAFFNAITPQGRIEVFDAGYYGGNMIFSLKANAGTASGPLVEYMRITEAGRVGIGTTNPVSKVHISGASSTYTQGQLFISDANYTDQRLRLYSYYGGSLYTSFCSIQSVQEGVAASYLCLNPSGGNVGIGTITPGNSLQIHGTTGSGHWANSCMRLTNGISSTDNATSNGTSIQLTNGYNAAYFNIMSYGFSPGGTSAIYVIADSGVGVQLARGSNAWGAYSDARMKINITPITSTLPDIMKLEPVSYLYETDIDNHCNITYRIGFTAQNINSIYPHLVTKDASHSYTNKNGETFIPMTLTITDLIPYLTKGIQEQHNEIITLKQQNITQQSQIDALIQRLAAAGIA